MEWTGSAQARQRLLFMCACCGNDNQLRYYTAALMEEVLSVLGCNLASAPAEDQAEQLLLMTCACMLSAAEKFRPDADMDAEWRAISDAAARARGSVCHKQLSQQSVLEAKALLQEQLQLDDRRPLTTDYIESLHGSPLLQALPEMQYVKLELCYTVCDVLLCSTQFAGLLANGGKLMAAAILAATWMTQVPISEVPAIAPMQRLEQLSGCAADVLEVQAHVVMQIVLDAAD